MRAPQQFIWIVFSCEFDVLDCSDEWGFAQGNTRARRSGHALSIVWLRRRPADRPFSPVARTPGRKRPTQRVAIPHLAGGPAVCACRPTRPCLTRYVRGDRGPDGDAAASGLARKACKRQTRSRGLMIHLVKGPNVARPPAMALSINCRRPPCTC